MRIPVKQKFILFVLLLSSILVSPVGGQAAALECRNLPQIFELYLRNHYVVRKLSPVVEARTIDQFIKEMDPSKTLLLDQDVASLKKELLGVFSGMRLGNCAFLKNISDRMIARAEGDFQFVKNYLGKAYKLDESVELVWNPEKRGFPKTLKDRQDLLQKMIHFQISGDLVAGINLEEAKKHVLHKYELFAKRLKERSMNKLMADYTEAFALALDPHSGFLSKDDLEDFQIEMRLSLVGIGASLASRDGFIEIEELIAGGGADRTKLLRRKDKIIAVAEASKKPVSVIDMDLRDVVKLIRGTKGTKVTLTILRQAEKSQTFTVTIARDKVDIKEQAASISYSQHKLGDKTFKVGYVDLPSFYGDEESGGRSSSQDVKKLLEEAKKEKVSGIVMDLSRNGGGLLEEAVRIAGLFIRKGGIVATKDADGNVQVLSSQHEEVTYAGPLVILTSRLSASASEILAGALKDYKRALIVGQDRTFGKGTVQVISSLPGEMGALKVTTGMFFLPGGESTQYSGVSSHVTLPPVFNDEDIGEKTMEYSLIPQSIPEFQSKEANSSQSTQQWASIDSAKVSRLIEKSKERVKKDPLFIKSQKEIQEMKKNKGKIRLADLRKASSKESLESINEANPHQRIKDIEAPMIQESIRVLVDLIAA